MKYLGTSVCASNQERAYTFNYDRTIFVYKDWLWDQKAQTWWQSSMKCIIKTIPWHNIFYVLRKTGIFFALELK